MDSKNDIGSPDRGGINVHENHEVEYWTKELAIGKEDLAKEVHAIGASAKQVRMQVNA